MIAVSKERVRVRYCSADTALASFRGGDIGVMIGPMIADRFRAVIPV